MWYLVQTILYAERTRWEENGEGGWGGWGSRVRSFVGFILYTSYIRLWNDMQNKPAQYACKLIVCHQWMMCLHSTSTACLNRMIQISGTDASERCVHVRLCGVDTESWDVVWEWVHFCFFEKLWTKCDVFAYLVEIHETGKWVKRYECLRLQKLPEYTQYTKE